MKKDSPITKIAKIACPAVISIVVSKDLPKMEGFQSLPLGMQELILPKSKHHKKQQIKIGGGSGFIISKDGLVLTCNHVVKDPSASYLVVLGPDEKHKAEVLAKDPLIDLAILKIKGDDFPFIELGDSSKTQLGEKVIAVGNPLGEFDDTLSAGIVSGLSRKITAYGSLAQSRNLRGLIQTDAAINPGNSGGPLVDMDGKVIGINTAVVQGSQNIGFAIPINYTKENIKEVKKYGKIKKPFLGIKYFILNKKIAHINKIPVDYGAMILRERLGEEAVIDGSPADKAGLKAYDIILSCNGEKITKDNSLNRVLQKHNIGDVVKLKVLREEKEIETEVELSERK